jgi:hypothetical protein
MDTFDYFIALDGNGLNGFEGFAGVARLRCTPSRDRYDIAIQFFDGLAGGHATQVNKEGTLAYLGNLSQTLLFYDPRTLREVRRCSTLRFAAPEVPYSSQTHVVWLAERTFITVLGPDFFRFDLDDLEHPVRLGPHGVTLPHAVKRSPSGRYLFYGAMDHDVHGHANQVGIFDLETNTPRVVRLPATVWHLGLHTQRDVFYAPTQRCAPQGDMEFNEYTIAHLKNYLFEIDGETATVTRHLSIPKDLPASLTSDVVVTGTDVFYNACASNVIVRVDLATLSRVTFIDERPGALGSLRSLRTTWSNVVESFSRANVPGNTHVLLKAMRATRFSAVDGSYGLQLSPDGQYLLSAHRGLNEVIVYRLPEVRVVRRIAFPPIRRWFPQHFGPLDDPRLGFHHTALSTATVA